MPGGLALVAAVSGDEAVYPPLWQLLAVVPVTVLVVAALTIIPARLGAHRPAAEASKPSSPDRSGEHSKARPLAASASSREESISGGAEPHPRGRVGTTLRTSRLAAEDGQPLRADEITAIL
jgi:hypothetical protein